MPDSITRIETFSDGDSCVVRVTAEDGSQGIGQTAPKMTDITATVLHDQLSPLALGRDLSDPDALSDTIWEKLYKFHGTYVARALSGLDTAIWDLNAKRAGVPVWQLLGGRGDPLRVYASSMVRNRSAADEVAALAEACERTGATAVKFKIGARRGAREPMGEQRARELVPLVRKALGDRMEMLVDANGSYTAAEAIEMGRLLEHHGVSHYEEPCRHDELEETAAVAAALDLPVAGGEQDYLLPQFRRMFVMKAVDIAQLDVCYVGGFSRALRVATMAADHGLPLTPHASNQSMVLIFTLHLLASIPNAGKYVEYGLGRSEPIYEPVLQPRDGRIALPAEPGWGVRIRESWLATTRHRESVR
jgi:L-alanine-DL-glutamate epimerase-like enolase superfamily enzyme